MFGAATADAATTQTGSYMDGGGIRWTAKAIWGGTYTSGGVRKVSINYAGWTTNGRAVPTDSTVRTYSGDGTRIQKLTWSGVYDYKGGTAYRVRNAQPGQRARQGQDQDQPRRRRRRPRQLLGHLHPARQCWYRWRRWRLRERPLQNRRGLEDQRRADWRELRPLSFEACVDRYAEQQAARMAAERRMYHQDLGPILRACNLSAVGENVAYGYPSGSAVMGGGWDRAGTEQTS